MSGGREGSIVLGMESENPKPNDADDRELEPDPMIEPDADPLDTEVEDADLFLGDGDDEPGEDA